jgi:hypothetical protein
MPTRAALPFTVRRKTDVVGMEILSTRDADRAIRAADDPDRLTS